MWADRLLKVHYIVQEKTLEKKIAWSPIVNSETKFYKEFRSVNHNLHTSIAYLIKYIY